MDNSSFIQFAAASGAMGLLISWILQSLKRSKFIGWLSVESGRLNFLVSAIMSFAAAMAINYSFEMGSIMTGGAFKLVISGSLLGIMHGVIRWGWQMLNTHGMYKLFIVPAEAQGEIKCLLKQLLEGQAAHQAAAVESNNGRAPHVGRASYADSPRR